jgi:hypothetical protein
MSFLVSLHSRRVFTEAGSGVEYAKLYVTLSGTSTQVDTYADSAGSTQQSYPVEADADGVFPAVYVTTNALLRLRVTDQNDVDLPGFPQDSIAPELADEQDASGIAFNPTAAVPETNVQSAIETVAALFTDQSDLLVRALTAWPTGGTSNAYTVTPSPAITDYGSHQFFILAIDRANTGAATINVNGLGTRNLQKLSRTSVPGALASGDLQPGMNVPCWYDGTRFILMLPGVPTTGSNGNGSYIRMPTGVQICWKQIEDPTTPINNAAFGGFQSDTEEWTFPLAFAATPVVVASVPRLNAFGIQANGTNTTTAGYAYTAITSQAGVTRYANLIAIGVWF